MIDFTTLPTYAFLCYLTSTWNPTGAGDSNLFSSGATIEYQESATVSSNGVFTAPVDGIYDFTGCAYTNSQSYLSTGLTKNGSLYFWGGTKSASTGASRIPLSAVGIKLNQGDTINMNVQYAANPSFSSGRINNWFSGHLVRAL